MSCAACKEETNGKTGAAGKRGALIGPEAWLERGGREGVDEDDRQQKDEDEKRKQSEDERENHTGTPIFGLPPVPFGVVADFICCVYS